MKDEPQGNNDQEASWNGPAGLAWVQAQGLLDAMFQPFEDLLAQTPGLAGGGCVLDVGCGTGATTLAIAKRLGPRGQAVGIDISAPMLDVAEARAVREGAVAARFIRADAQSHAFEPAGFDHIVSRFGIMFFADPVRAFSNLRRAASSGAGLHCIAWRGAAENPFMTTAERAAAPLLPNLPARRPGEPGQFAFADGDRARAILEEGGWAGVGIEPINVACSLPERDLLRYLGGLGPVGAALRQADEATRRSVTATVRAAFEPYVAGAQVRFTAACWRLVGRAS